MAHGALDVLGERIDRGVILTKHGHMGAPVSGFDAYEAGHPVPDEDGAYGTREVIASVEGLGPDDVVLALISGGGSALLELPREPLTLADMQETTRLLLRAGATIHDLNAVRSALSQVKGGGLRRIIGTARCVSLLLSDVLGNDPGVIASGPTIPGAPSRVKARDILDRFHVVERVPAAVREFVELPDAAPEAPNLGQGDVCTVIADNTLLVAEVERLLGAEGLKTSVAWRAWDGDAGELGRRMVRDAGDADEKIDVLLGGGEATVEVTGDGIGGRNTETSLVAAIELERSGLRWVLASLASDGQDGASDAAGAIADPDTCARGRRQGLDPDAFLRNNDSATFFERADGLVVTGPSGTNVNDVYIAMRR
jgi:glycerate-2-kinase